MPILARTCWSQCDKKQNIPPWPPLRTPAACVPSAALASALSRPSGRCRWDPLTDPFPGVATQVLEKMMGRTKRDDFCMLKLMVMGFNQTSCKHTMDEFYHQVLDGKPPGYQEVVGRCGLMKGLGQSAYRSMVTYSSKSRPVHHHRPPHPPSPPTTTTPSMDPATRRAPMARSPVRGPARPATNCHLLYSRLRRNAGPAHVRFHRKVCPHLRPHRRCHASTTRPPRRA